jgi:F-type H+-transporting ATPase subunit epsilon
MAEKTLHVEIVTPYEMFYEGPAEMVIVTCKDGEIGVLPGHIPLVAALTSGEVRMKIGDQTKVALTTNGFAEIGPELVIIVVNAAEWPDQIDVQRAQMALDRASARLADPSLSALEKKHARHGAERAKARLKIAGKYAGANQNANQGANQSVNQAHPST